MPEGDTIFRAAATLQRALAGSTVLGFVSQIPALNRVEVTGRTVEFARPAGKWLQIGFSGDLILLTHMLMSGSWHIYRPAERWRKSRYHMRIAITTASIIAVAFNVPVAEFHSSESLGRRRGLSQLGPDILSPGFDEAEAVANLEAHPDLEIGDALLKQSILAGLGNLFKSEVCFASRVHPFQCIGDLSRMQIEAIVSNAKKLLSRPRVTLVYRRNGEPCPTCGALIVSRKQGADARTSFWCPTCQPKPESSLC